MCVQDCFEVDVVNGRPGRRAKNLRRAREAIQKLNPERNQRKIRRVTGVRFQPGSQVASQIWGKSSCRYSGFLTTRSQSGSARQTTDVAVFVDSGIRFPTGIRVP